MIKVKKQNKKYSLLGRIDPAIVKSKAPARYHQATYRTQFSISFQYMCINVLKRYLLKYLSNFQSENV